MPKITMYTTRWCGYCVRAKTLLDSRGLDYEEVNLSTPAEPTIIVQPNVESILAGVSR